MSESERLTPAEIVGVFMKFLSDDITAMNAQDVLQLMLRTDGQLMFTPQQIAKVCQRWAVGQNEHSGIPIYQSFCTSLLRIYQAEAFCSLAHFKLDDFVRPFVHELYQLCPAQERGVFKEELPNVKTAFQKSMETESAKRMPEYEVQVDTGGQTRVTEGEWIRITGERFSQLVPALQGIVHNEHLRPEERAAKLMELMPQVRSVFDNIISESILKERLPDLIWLGRDLFNQDEIESANQLLSFVAEIVDNRKDQFLEKEVSSLVSIDHFNPEVINQHLVDPARKKMLKPLFSNIFETRPLNLLSSLVQEEDSQKRKQLLRYITIFEPEIFHPILAELRNQNLTKWYFRRNLLYLITLIQLPEGLAVGEVLDVIKTYIYPGVHQAVIQEAVRAYLSFDALGGVKWIIDVLKAEHVSNIIPLEKFYPPEELEQFKGYLVEGVAAFDLSHNARAVGVILEAARSEVAKVSLKLGKLVMGLNVKLVTSLIKMLSGSGSPPVANALKDFVAEAKVPQVREAASAVLQAMHHHKKAFI